MKSQTLIRPFEFMAAKALSSGRHAISSTKDSANAAPTGSPFPSFCKKLTTTDPSLDPDAINLPLLHEYSLN